MRFTTATFSTLSLLFAFPTFIVAVPCKSNEIGIGFMNLGSVGNPVYGGGDWRYTPTIFATDCGILYQSPDGDHYCHQSDSDWSPCGAIVACNGYVGTSAVSSGGHYANYYKPSNDLCADFYLGSATVEYCCIRGMQWLRSRGIE